MATILTWRVWTDVSLCRAQAGLSEEGGDKDQTDVRINNVGCKTYSKPLKWRAMNSYHVNVCRPFATYSSPLYFFDKGGGHNVSPPAIPACVHTCHLDSYHGNLYWVMLQKGGHVMVWMLLRVESKRLRRRCLCFFYIFWSIQDNITQGNQECYSLNLWPPPFPSFSLCIPSLGFHICIFSVQACNKIVKRVAGQKKNAEPGFTLVCVRERACARQWFTV